MSAATWMWVSTTWEADSLRNSHLRRRRPSTVQTTKLQKNVEKTKAKLVFMVTEKKVDVKAARKQPEAALVEPRGWRRIQRPGV